MPGGGGGGIDAVASKLEALEAQQRCQADALQEQRAEIQSLKAGLDEARREINELKSGGGGDGALTKDAGLNPLSTQKTFRGDAWHAAQTAYQSENSMWDAALLCFFTEVCLVDRFVIALGMLLNHGLQVTLIVVVMFDMLDNPFPQSKVGTMLEWRALNGHADSNFQTVLGKSRIEMLCNQELWTYEQDQYDEMYSYLYKPVPGYALSLIALVLWVMTTIVEYRRTVEQAMAILALPTASSGETCIREGDEGEIQIVSMRRSMRVLALLLLSLPRIVVVALLSWIGCRYLAQTPSLADIVLNAVALSFVMDVDELLYDLVCTQRIRGMLENLKPLSCGRPGTEVFGSLKVKDLIRYGLALGLVVMAFFVYLVPFYNNIEGAANALCGGMYDFSYRGGTSAQTTVMLQNSTGSTRYCQGSTMGEYLEDHYTGYNFSLNVSMSDIEFESSTADNEDRLTRAVLNYAMKGCPPGQILKPELADREIVPDRVCMPLPPTLLDALPTGVTPGLASDPPRCHAFMPELFTDLCTNPPEDGDTCLWSHESQNCESDPPGNLQSNGCLGQAGPTLADFHKACRPWLTFGYHATPYYNCRAEAYCGPPTYDCLMVSGQLLVDHGNPAAFDLNGAKTAVQQSLEVYIGQSGSPAGLPPSGPPVVNRAEVLVGLQPAAAGPGDPWIGGPTAPPQPSGTSRAVLYFRVGPTPVSIVPERIFFGNTSSVLAHVLMSASPQADVVQASFSGIEFSANHTT